VKRLGAILLALLIASDSFAAITRVNTLHQYIASSGTGYSLGTVTAGNLIVCKVSSGNNGTVSLSGSVNGAYTQLTQRIFDTNFSHDMFYKLSSGAGAESITITTSNTDNGISCAEFQDSGAGTWSFDTSISVDGSAQAATASPRSGNYTTSGNGVVYMSFADETATWSGTCATFPCPTGSFSNINWDNTHIDADAEWLNSTAGTQSSGWDATSAASTHWSIFVAAFKTSSGGATIGSLKAIPGTGQMTTVPGTGILGTK
jgi:hypothetical protein